MSVSYNVCGIKPPDEKFSEMLKIYSLCEKNNIPIPNDVAAFFGHVEPDESGVKVDIDTIDYLGEYEEGVEIRVSDIPKDVKFIRFYVSY